ncbi:MAG: hypothetical protein JXB48_05175 [Candidatus Latescibacteria bacterium]|nr:hypothetical protein [Candidatus Latescibacterota bacterium]
MQISTMTNTFNSPYENINYSRTYLSEKTVSQQSSLNVSYDDTGNLSQIRISERMQYHETTYSAEGITSQSTPTPFSILDNGELKEAESTEYIQDQYLEILRRRVAYLLNELIAFIKNSGDSNTSNNDNSSGHTVSGYQFYSETTLSVSESVTIEGSGITSDYYSAEQTAGRIINFALSFYDGGDRGEYISMIKDAVLKGYREAVQALGGYVPAEVQDTMTLVIHALDSFASGDTVDFSA